MSNFIKIQEGQSLAYQAQYHGFKSALELERHSGESVRTLRNWLMSPRYQRRFENIIYAAIERKRLASEA